MTISTGPIIQTAWVIEDVDAAEHFSRGQGRHAPHLLRAR
jgi:hypothetical protein